MRDLYRGDGGPLSSYDEGWNDGVEAAMKALSSEVETVAVANCPSLCDEFCNAYQVHAALVRLEVELAAIKAAQEGK